jgi:hypothetical protein
MKFPLLFLAAAALAFAQAPLKVAAVSPATAPAPQRQILTDLEKRLDTKVSQVGGKDQVYLLGLTRGLYLAGYGTVFTQELDLIETPGISPFHQQISPQEIVTVHQRKLANLAALRKTLRDMWADAAQSLTATPDTEQVVLAVRLLYRSWEDTSGLPSEIVLKGPRRAAPGSIPMEEQ